MSFVAQAGSPYTVLGMPNRGFAPSLAALSNTLSDAANESCMMVGVIITSDGASHTIDTTGASSIGMRFGAVTSANAGTTIKVGIGDVDTAVGPPGRAANAADVITMDVSKTMTGTGLITANAWSEFVPDAGTKTIANGQLVAVSVQMTALGGADLFNTQTVANVVAGGRPNVTAFLGGAYADQTRLPNCFITFADGAFGWFAGGYVASVGVTTLTWNNGSATKEYGNILRFERPMKCYGILATAAVANLTDFILYSDPLGTPVAEKTISVDQNTLAITTTSTHHNLFAAPFDILPNVDYAAIMKPTTATNCTMTYVTQANVNHQLSWQLGLNAYAINRNAGAFAAQNSSLDRFAIGLLVGGGDNGAGSGGGMSRARGSC